MYTNFVDKAHDDDVHRHTHKNIIAIRYRLTAFVFFFVYSGSCMFFGNDSMSIGAVITTTETPTNSSSTIKIQKQAPKDYINQLKNKNPRTNNTRAREEKRQRERYMYIKREIIKKRRNRTRTKQSRQFTEVFCWHFLSVELAKWTKTHQFKTTNEVFNSLYVVLCVCSCQFICVCVCLNYCINDNI